jgi:hypothetical protein
MSHRHAEIRKALTLLEVVLALAILAGSLGTLAQLVGLGMRAAGNSRDLTQAQLLAESTMSEIAAGILSTEPLTRVPLDTNPGWLVSTQVDNTIHQGILRVTILLERDSDSYRSIQYQVSRWIRDPNLALPVEEETATDEGSGSSPSSGNSGDSSGGDNSGLGGGNGNGGNGGGSNRGNGNGANRGNRGGNAPGQNPQNPSQSGGGRRPGGGAGR